MFFRLKRKPYISILSIIILLTISLVPQVNVLAAPDYLEEAELRKALPVETNELEDWPDGPALGAESAFLIESNTGTILYAKNMDEKLYPASTTKLLTCLLIVENCSLDEVVTFSTAAIESITLGDSNMAARIGDQITVEQALYAILVGSANEAAYAMAEHISGSIEGFADLMNQRALEIGCKNTHFVTPNGLHDEDHYTSAYDLALIAKEFFKNELLCKISSTPSYTISASEMYAEEITLYSKNQLFADKAYAYPYLVGSKTGYTSLARQTLVSCAQKDGLSLICVIMKEEGPYQFTDTVSLFDYGFSNFSAIKVAEADTHYSVNVTESYHSDYAIWGSQVPILSLDKDSYIVLPVSASLEDTVSTIEKQSDDASVLSVIHYTFNGIDVGTVPVNIAHTEASSLLSDNVSFVDTETNNASGKRYVYLNLKFALFIVVIIFVPLFAILCINSLWKQSSFSKRHKAKKRRKRSSPTKLYKF